MPQEGMLLQIDDSHHRWLEDIGPRFVLLLAVDDATGTVVNALGRPAEDTRGYFLLMEGVIRSYGIPLDIYGDRHGVFKFNGKHRHITQPVGPTQFTRAVGELGIERTDLCPFAPGREYGLDVGLPGGVQKPADDRIGGAATRAAFQP